MAQNETLNVDTLLGQLRERLDAADARASAAERYAAQAEAENERLHSVHELVARSGLILDDLATWREVAARATALNEADTALRTAKAMDLPAAKERVSEAETEATMAAYAEGAVTGKNAEQRKVELDAYLAGQERVVKAREHLRASRRIVNLKAAVAVADAEHKAALGRWNAARSGAVRHADRGGGTLDRWSRSHRTQTMMQETALTVRERRPPSATSRPSPRSSPWRGSRRSSRPISSSPARGSCSPPPSSTAIRASSTSTSPASPSRRFTRSWST